MRNFLTEMLDALTSAYSRKDHDNRQLLLPVETNIGKLFAVFAWGLDSVQEQAELIKLWDNIDYAKGSVLDRYGANFGVKRFGATDVFYRLAIKVKLLSQLSGGDIDTVLNAAASLFEVPVERIVMDELFPSKVCLNIREADLSQETFDNVTGIVAMIKRILAAGVKIDLNLILKPPAFQEPIGDLYLYRLKIASSFCNIRDMPVRFDGAVNFDGEALFDQAFRGLIYQRFLVRSRFVTLQSGIAIRFDGAVNFDGSELFNQEFGVTHFTAFKARIPIQNTAETFSGQAMLVAVTADEPPEDMGLVSMAVRATAKHTETTSGELTMDNWRTFDGAVTFDGSRHFDAYYVKEEF